MKEQEMKPIGEIFDLEKTNLDDISDRLWYEYFTPATPHEPSFKRFIMDQYNLVVEKINAIAGLQRTIKITRSMTWDNQKKENPISPKPIYVDVVLHSEANDLKDSFVAAMGITETKKGTPVVVKKTKKSKADKQQSLQQPAPAPAKKQPFKKADPKPEVKIEKPVATNGVELTRGEKSKKIVDHYKAYEPEVKAKKMEHRTAIDNVAKELLPFGVTRKAIVDAVWRYQNQS